MTDTYVAKANVVKVSIGPADGNRVARIIRAGGAIPDGVDEASLKALAARGLIELVTPASAPVVAETETEAEQAAKAAADAAKVAADAVAAAAKKPAGK